MNPPDSTSEDGFRILQPDGSFDSADIEGLDLKDQALQELYRLMRLARRVDTEATALQRQGELAVWGPLIGQEAAQVGATFALEPDDFVFPSYRELGAALVKGVDPVDYLHFYRGTWHGGTYNPYEHGFGMISVPVASQILHAVGYAMGAKLDGRKIVTVPFFGDGATSQGDFHEGCNFAAVFEAPVVFFCQNNHWAISVPLEKQTRAPIYKKAEAYGFPGVRVDGNDVLAVYKVMKEAVDRARAEGAPTLIEAVTYRLGPHSTADDAGRYQPPEEVERWRGLDPIERYRRFLDARELWNEAKESALQEEADALAARIRSSIAGALPGNPTEMFNWVFATKTEHLSRQERELREDVEQSNDA